MYEIVEVFGRMGLIPVITIERPEDAVPLAQALLAGDVQCVEITFRTAAAEEAIRRIAREVPAILVGAGTVLTIQQARKAVDAGAHYIFAPGFDEDLVVWCRGQRVPVIPGAATATEITLALRRGLSLLKFFPAEELGGTRMLKALAGPFREIKFIPTGGINAKNLPDYLRLPNVVACGGSWIAESRLVSEGRFDEITHLAQEARFIISQARAEGGQEG